MKSIHWIIVAVVITLIIGGRALINRERAVEGKYSGGKVEKPAILKSCIGRPQIIRKNALGAYRAGTGFLFDYNGGRYLSTAFHIFASGWSLFKQSQLKVQEISLVRGKEVLSKSNEALSMASLGATDGKDASGDLAIFKVPADPGSSCFRLAAYPPTAGTPVWIVTVSRGGEVSTLLSPAVVAYSSNKRIRLTLKGAKPHYPWSGAPVVNHNNEVVGATVWHSREGIIAVPLDAFQRTMNKY